MLRDRSNLFQELLAAIAYYEWARDYYGTLTKPTRVDGVNNIIGTLDALWEIRLLIKEIEDECKGRGGK